MFEINQGDDAAEFAGGVPSGGRAPELPQVGIGAEDVDVDAVHDDTAADDEVNTEAIGNGFDAEDATTEDDSYLVADADLSGVDADLLGLPPAELAALRETLLGQVDALTAEVDRQRDRLVGGAVVSLDAELAQLLNGG